MWRGRKMPSMLDKERSPRTNIVILVVIAGIALVLSISLYQYSILTSKKIVDIASQEIRSNTRIEVHDISQILANKLQTVGALLQTLAEAPALHNNEYKIADIVINNRQHSSSDLADFYMWLDKNGKINWISDINETIYQKYKGTDLSYRPYFANPKDTHTVYYSSLIESNDKVPRLYISYPIINTTGTTKGILTGVVVASIRLETLGNFLKNQLYPQFNSTIELLDRNGIILYASGAQQYVGEYIFGDKFQSVLSSSLHPPESKNLLNDLISKSLQGNTGSGDILINDKMNTIAYQPVAVNGKNFLTLHISAQHSLATDVIALINQQEYFTTLIIAIIGAVAIIIAFLVFSWNKRLETVVNTRTAELKTANDSLALANERLKIHHKMQQDFTNVAAHELRTPIQPILGMSQLLQQKLKDSQYSEYFDVLTRNASRLQRLTEDILDVQKIESQILQLNKERFDLHELISSIVKDYKNQLQNDRVELLHQLCTPEAIIVYADKNKLTQVISNLLSNAIKFTKKGTIIVAEEVKDGKAVVSIKDTGQGIDPEIMPRLFDKFASRSFQGTGIGLFISKGIIEAHGGKIWAENHADGKGATFHFTLPISTNY
jgi:signal transduction histidine kinase